MSKNIERILFAIYHEMLAARYRECWLGSRVPVHGPPPQLVVEWLHKETQMTGLKAFHDLWNYGAPSFNFFQTTVGLPKKGTGTRRAYDRWMRKKVNQCPSQ